MCYFRWIQSEEGSDGQIENHPWDGGWLGWMLIKNKNRYHLFVGSGNMSDELFYLTQSRESHTID
ncbi:hypothetical protein GCM10020370_19200 [Paenibacillus hodogayensis]